MEEEQNRVVFPSTEAGLAEERMLGQELVQEMVARKTGWLARSGQERRSRKSLSSCRHSIRWRDWSRDVSPHCPWQDGPLPVYVAGGAPPTSLAAGARALAVVSALSGYLGA